jgi:dihydrodipicolinate synthase/N-acetylneuraminate lyase
MSILKGVIPVIPTPFTEDGTYIEYDSFAKLVELAIKDGANAIALFGAGGEF